MLSSDVATIVSVIPPVGALLLVIKWIVSFQREITDKYREELRVVREQFDEYKLSTERKIAELETRLDSLANILKDEQDHKARIIAHLSVEGISLPPELERRKVSK